MTYNHFESLKNTILSVISQDYEDIEYIIADDGSKAFPKETVETLLSSSGFPDYKLLLSEKNRGTVANATEACRTASGQYIVFLSCGDVFYAENTVSRIAERFRTTNADVIAGRRLAFTGNYEAQWYLPHTKSLKILERLDTSDKQYKAFISNHHWDACSGSALYYSKKILEESGYFDSKYRLWEDGPFIEKYLRSHAITYAFDIVGLWYELGGISTGGGVNPLIKKDCDLFDREGRSAKKDTLGWFYRHHIDYIRKRTYCTNSFSVARLWLRYPFVTIYQIWYVIRLKLFRSADHRLLNNMHIQPPRYFRDL